MSVPPVISARPRQRPGGGNYRQRRPNSEFFPKERFGKRRPFSEVIEPSTNVFINFIPPNYTEADLQALCSQYGEIVCSKIMIDLDTGQSRGFGFVNMRTLEQATALIRGIDGMIIGNKKLLAKYAESQEKHEPISTMLYIKRLPLSINAQVVFQLFSRFGEILQISSHNVDTIEPQYWRCFVQFATQSSATEAMHEMNNQIIIPGTRPIHVRYANKLKLKGTSIVPIPIVTREAPAEPKNLLPSFFFN